MSTQGSDPAFLDHLEWLGSMHAQLNSQSTINGRHSPVGGVDCLSPPPFFLGTSPRPFSAMAAAAAENYSELENQVRTLTLDDELVDDDDEPLVFRSVYDVPLGNSVSEEVDDAEPIYRCIDLAGIASQTAPVGIAGTSPCDPCISSPTQQAAEARWLDTMPPLVRRQHGGVLG